MKDQVNHFFHPNVQHFDNGIMTVYCEGELFFLLYAVTSKHRTTFFEDVSWVSHFFKTLSHTNNTTRWYIRSNASDDFTLPQNSPHYRKLTHQWVKHRQFIPLFYKKNVKSYTSFRSFSRKWLGGIDLVFCGYDFGFNGSQYFSVLCPIHLTRFFFF